MARRSIALWYLIVLAGAGLLYVFTCAPGILWQDGGMYQYRIWHNDIEGRLGLALSHPLHHIIGIAVKYIPIGEFAYRVNLISAVAAAFTIANLFLLLRLWLGKNLPAIIAAITLALSWTIWRFASIAEVYTLYTALLLAELLMLLQYVKTRRMVFLYLLGLFNGLAIANHMWAVIAFACYVVFLATLLFQKQIKLRHFGIIVGLWVIGAAPYEYLIIRKYIETSDFTATMASALFGNNWQDSVLNVRFSTRLVKENLIFMAYNFPTPNIIFFFAGLYGLIRGSSLVTRRSSGIRDTEHEPRFTNVLLALLVLFFVFAFRYTVPDRYAFFIPFYCLVSILIGVGFNSLLSRPNRKILSCVAFILMFLPIPAYIIVPVVAQRLQFKLPSRGNIHYRDDYTWFLRPWRTGYRGPEQFANEAFNMVENNAVIYADGTTVYALLYAQEVKNRRTDVRIVSDHPNRKNPLVFNEQTVPQLLREASVYVVSPAAGYCPGFLLEQYEFKKVGVLWKVAD